MWVWLFEFEFRIAILVVNLFTVLWAANRWLIGKRGVNTLASIENKPIAISIVVLALCILLYGLIPGAK
jgi:hypothetical protein